MSKFCPTCGSNLADDAVFCANCGSSIAPAAEPAYAAPVYEAPAYEAPVEEKPAKAKKKLSGKLIAIIAVAAVVVIGLVAWILIANPFADPTEPLKDYYAYYYAEELSLDAERNLVEGLGGDALKKIYNIYASTKQFEGYKTDGGDKIPGEADSWEDRIEGYEDNMGKDWEYDYKVINKYQMPSLYSQSMDYSLLNQGIDLLESVDTLNEMDEDEIENIADYLDIEVSDVEDLIDAFKKLADELIKANVTDAYEITYQAIRDGEDLREQAEENDEEYDEDTFSSMTVYKINGKWVSSKAISLVSERVSNFISRMMSGSAIEAK